MEVFKYKGVTNKVNYSALRFDNLHEGKRVELVFAWSTIKGDYWKANAQAKAKFFGLRKTTYENETVQYGLYIGRLALAILKGKITNVNSA